MHAVSDIADWWDEQHRQARKELDLFVENNPNLFGVVVATAVATAMEVGAGTVDTLRFGQGLAQGGVKGFGQDALRLIGLAGPMGRGASTIHASANARLARLIVDPGGGICGWVSGTQALRQTGTKSFAAVDDLARALGTSVSALGGSHLGGRVELFKQIGARISAIRPVKSFDDIARMTRNNGSVTMFNVFGKRMERGVLKQAGHAVYAFRDGFGRLRIMDRGGSTGETGEVFDSLQALAKKYGIRGSWSLKEAAVMENVFAKFMGSMSSAPVFALDAYAFAGVNKLENETVAQAFEVHKVVMRKGKKALAQGGFHHHVVAPGENLSMIARRFYGEQTRWPVVYEANRDEIGNSPHMIKLGQRLLIPPLPKAVGIKGLT